MLTVHIPHAAPAELVEGHRRHGAVEFLNWTEMAPRVRGDHLHLVVCLQNRYAVWDMLGE